jgi:predicted metalloprotease with PDZ domain
MPIHIARPFLTLALTLLAALVSPAQVRYTLSYLDSTSGKVQISIQPDMPLTKSIVFIMPRSVPGNYGVTKYDGFIRNVLAENSAGATRPLMKDEDGAPRWSLNDSGFIVNRLTYEVDIKKMEAQLHAASDKSLLRPGFAGLLNYSVFGWIDGYDRRPVRCSIHTFSSWPIFSTITPNASPTSGNLEFETSDYYTLADAQTFIGPRFRVKEYKALVPLFIADYSETKEADLDNYAWMETHSMEILKGYFGELPFPHYTALFRETIPLPDDDPGNFAMEHLQSSTFFGDTSRIVTSTMTEAQLWRRMPSYLHHMAHAFIPLRCFGDTYRPYVLEIPPVINNIWFNEGFMWYIVADTLKTKSMIDRFRNSVYNGAPAIRQMTLQQLSQIASTQYAEDFRLGEAIFSRGALMALEINDYVRSQTGGKASMRTIYRYLYDWSRRNGRPFTLQEFPDLLKSATGVDVSAIYNKWQAPITTPSPIKGPPPAN